MMSPMMAFAGGDRHHPVWWIGRSMHAASLRRL
jgi:hypothetical protein